jgi:hypothetical protein
MGACTTGKLWRIVNLRKAKFSVWFSGEGPDWWLYNGEAVENCEPEKGEKRNSLFGFRVKVLIGACTTGKLWRIVYLRRAKFSVWFSGEGPEWCLYNGEAVENCVPEKGEILRLPFRVRVLISACTTWKLWRIANLRKAKFSVWISGEGPDWCL